jgi:hypothetical protein
MRRMLVALTVSAGVLVLPSSASAQVDLLEFQSAVDAMLAVDPTLDPPPNDPRKDFAVGGGRTVIDDLGFALSAHSGPLGEEAKGHMSFGGFVGPGEPEKEAQVTVDVTCLRVAVKTATVGGEITHINPTARRGLPEFLQEGGGIVFAVVDNGNPVMGQPVDLAQPVFPLPDEPPVVCPPAPVPIFEGLSNGNILVHDAVP